MPNNTEIISNEATKLDSEVRELWYYVSRAWAEIGHRCQTLKEKGLYRELGFESFEDYLADCGFKRSTIYGQMALVSRLAAQGMEIDAMSRLSQQNAKQLLRLGKSKWTPEVIAAAEDKTEAEFESFIDSRVGGFVEKMVRRVLVMPEELAGVYDRTMELAKKVEECPAWEPAFESILSEYLLNHQDEADSP